MFLLPLRETQAILFRNLVPFLEFFPDWYWYKSLNTLRFVLKSSPTFLGKAMDTKGMT